MVKINLLRNILKPEKKKYKPKGFLDYIFYHLDRGFYEPEVRKKKKPPVTDNIMLPCFNFICKRIIQPIFRYDVYEYIKKQEQLDEKIFPLYRGISE